MIENIIIENYKSIKHLELELKKINILIGSNGVGKSNFISFFEMINAIYNQRFGSYTLERGGIDNLLYFGRKQSPYIKGLIDFNNTNAFFITLRPSQSNKGFIEETGDYFNGYNDKKKKYKNWNVTYWDRAVEESDISNNRKWRAAYLKNDLESFIVYHFHDTTRSSAMKQPCNISDNQYLRENGSNLAALLYLLSQNNPKVFKMIEGVIRSVAPFFERFDLKPDKLNPQMIQLEWKEKESDMYFNGYNLSDGTLRFIALTTLLMQPEPPEVIIIDEPELGLHPTAINKLAAMIRKASAKSQLIVSTQSPNLVNQFEPEDVVVVNRKGNQSIFNRLDKDKLTSWLEDYTLGDLWEKNVIGGQP